ncbi:DUF6221 family protein [Streptomyces sp. NPDC048669]|uniref:DUF6221 family protein n=1 Tax=Streptomyces sp. NPDC048669 TaxID=3155267 RepID=UPI0034329732
MQFLRDRLDEAQAQQEDAFTAWHSRDCEAVPDVWGSEPDVCTCGAPARVLREVEANRQMLAEHEPGTPPGRPNMNRHCLSCTTAQAWDETAGESNCRTLRLLALPYADHPDYQQEWTP